MNIVCFLWGNWPKGREYVSALSNMVARNVSLPYKFICFTDWNIQIPGVEFRRLPKQAVRLKRNLPKLYMYSEQSGLSGRVVCMDLDTVIYSNIDDLLSYSGDWCGVYQIKHEERGTSKPTHAGGLVSFRHDKFLWIWDELMRNPNQWERATEGKERVAMRLLFLKKGFQPDHWNYPSRHPQFQSYKKHIRKQSNDKPPKDAGFIAFHGNPRPHEAMQLPWVREHWK